MQGSTVEAMADAVEGAAVICYGISKEYHLPLNIFRYRNSAKF